MIKTKLYAKNGMILVRRGYGYRVVSLQGSCWPLQILLLRDSILFKNYT